MCAPCTTVGYPRAMRCGRRLLAFAGVTVACAAVLVARRVFLVVSVRGQSMEPTFVAGDRVLVLRRRNRRIRVADVVIARPPPGAGGGSALLVKRVAAAAGDPVPITDGALPPDHTVVPTGKLFVLGDNSEVSSDSRQFGYLPEDHVVGLVLRRLHLD